MKFTCDRCSAQYMISDEKVGPNGVRVRCKKCGNVVVVKRPPAEAPQAAPEAPRPAPAQDERGGLDAELGAAFDNAFGETPAPAPTAPAPEAAAAPDLAATQTMTAEERAKVTGAAPAPAATDWYVAIGEAQVGPLPLAEVKRKWEGGDVGPDSLVWRPGMADWAALSTLDDLAKYLAPVPRPSARNTVVREEARRLEAEPAAPAPKRDVSWKPAGASALKELAEKELSAPAEPKAAARSGASGANGAAKSSLLDAMNLPDSGVDPTGVFDLPIKGVERTGEQPKPKRESGVARDVQAVREKRTMTRAIVGGVAAVVVLVGVFAAGFFWYFNRQLDRVAVAAAPAAAPTQPAPAQPAPAEASPAPAPPPADPAPKAAEPTAVAAAEPSPAEQKAAPAPEPPKPAVAPAPKPEQKPLASAPKPPVRTEPARPARREPARTSVREAPRPPPERVASPERTAAATRPPARNDGLDFGGSDDALAEALGSGGGTGRSVYVPPRPGGTTGLPSSLSPAQINEAVAGRVDALRRCVSEQKAREPDASGVIKMQWTIMADGTPRNVRCVTPEYAKSQFASCIGNVVKGIRFPRSTTSGQEVTFPFSF